MYEGNLLAMSSQERKTMWLHALGYLVLVPATLIGLLIGFIIMVMVGGFIISLFTNALLVGFELVFGD
jgi:hypothetical protein